MATMFKGMLLNNWCMTQRHCIGFNNQIFIQTREYAARKGTRARREAKKIKKKVEKIEKIGFMEKVFKLKQANINAKNIKVGIPKNGKSVAVDDVWSCINHRPKVYSFEEALQCHRETLHPTVFNSPNSPVNLIAALNLQTEKKAKIIGASSRIIQLPHFFDHGESRNVILFASTPQMWEEAKQAGAALAGGKELIKAIKAGEVSLQGYEFYLAHPDILADLIIIRGLMKHKFPSAKHGTLGTSLKDLVNKHVSGLRYHIVPNKFDSTFGKVETSLGTLNMDAKHLEENFSTIIKDLYSVKTKNMSSFILRIQLTCPPSKEILEIDFEPYIKSEERSGQKKKEKVVVEEEEEDPEELDNEAVSRVVIPSH